MDGFLFFSVKLSKIPQIINMFSLVVNKFNIIGGNSLFKFL